MNPVIRLLLALAICHLTIGCAKEEKSEFGTKKVDVSAQRAALKSADTNAVMAACIELSGAGPKAEPAVQDLAELLKHSEPDVRRLAAYALFEIGEKAAPALAALKESLAKERNQAAAMQLMNTIKNIDPKASDLKTVNVMTR